MKSYTSKALTENSLTTTNRTAGNLFHLVLLVFFLATTSNSYGETTFTKIGDPVFEITGLVTGAAPGRSSDIWNDAESIFGPSHLVVGNHPSERSGPEVGIIPIEAIDVSIDQHVRREFAASGRVNTNVFAVEEIFWDRSWVRLLSLSPTSTAPSGASLHNSNGPVIPNDIYPLTHRYELYQNGTRVSTPSPRPRLPLGSVGLQTLDDGTEIDFTELNFGDYVVPLGWGAGRGHSLDSLAASYERRATITDRNGNGWEFSIPVETVRHATDILGDLNYNGEFDMQDLDILTQNVVVAPAEPHGEFLARLDLNGDETVDVSDVNHWVTELKSTWIGDANLDGEFNSGDFVEVFGAGKYETGELALWSEGDWNGDERFDSGDFIAAFQDGGYEMGARAAVAAVPEPSSLLMLMFGMLGIGRIRRR